MHPKTCEGPAQRPFRLGDLVLVVRKDQIAPSPVDVEPRSQVLHTHCRALDVPSRPARPPGAVPGGLSRLGSLPQSEIERIGLVLPHAHALAMAHLGHLLLGELAVLIEAGHFEVHVGAGLVGVAILDELGDQSDDFLDVLGGERLHVRTPQPQPVGVVPIGLGELGAHFRGRAAFGIGPLDDLVIDVSDVLHKGHPVAQRLEVPLGHHRHHVRAGVTDVHVAVDRGSTEVHGHVVLVSGDEFFLLLVQRVIQTHYRSSPSVQPCPAANAAAASKRVITAALPNPPTR